MEAMISVFIVFKICYRDNRVFLITFRVTHVHFLHKYLRNIERVSSAKLLCYDHTRSVLMKGQ